MLLVQKISFSYKKKPTISNISFDLGKGKSLAIIGESGCGKSTVLKLIYGLYDLDNGTIFWNKAEILGPKFNLIPGMEFMKYLAQDFDLMPFITVAENIGKYLSNVDLDKKNNRIIELLELVEMSEFANIKAKTLSGGQMQRVAIARVLALEPEILLLDEPFSHIDNFRKNSLQRKLFSYTKEKNITCIIATHDSSDVLSFTDELLVLKDGKMIEFGNSKTIYSNPKSKYIASLFDDVTEIEINGNNLLVYPHQFKIVNKSEIEVIVVNCYFRGNNYLIQSKHKNKTLYFESKIELNLHDVIFLEISK